MGKYSGFTGVFDSGIGGISILKALRKRLPYEDFVYFGDSANAPYGDKSKEEIERLSLAVTEHLVGNGVKAVVIACNTATSAAASTIRSRYPDIPVIGEEPAVKPACEALKGGKILVMATDATLRLDKFRNLYEKYNDCCDIRICNCSGLVDLIEKGDLNSSEIEAKLNDLLLPYKEDTEGIVLGCTHYPLISGLIKKVAGNVKLFDGSEGTARELERKLKEYGLLKQDREKGKTVFESSCGNSGTVKLYEKIFYGD